MYILRSPMSWVTQHQKFVLIVAWAFLSCQKQRTLTRDAMQKKVSLKLGRVWIQWNNIMLYQFPWVGICNFFKALTLMFVKWQYQQHQLVMACEWVYVYVCVNMYECACIYLFAYNRDGKSLGLPYLYTCLYSIPEGMCAHMHALI